MPPTMTTKELRAAQKAAKIEEKVLAMRDAWGSGAAGVRASWIIRPGPIRFGSHHYENGIVRLTLILSRRVGSGMVLACQDWSHVENLSIHEGPRRSRFFYGRTRACQTNQIQEAAMRAGLRIFDGDTDWKIGDIHNGSDATTLGRLLERTGWALVGNLPTGLGGF